MKFIGVVTAQTQRHRNLSSVTRCLRVKLCTCWFSAQRLVRRDYSHGATEPRRLFHRTAQNLSSVPPCLRVKPCSCWFSAQRLARRDCSHGDAEPRRLFHSTRTEPKLRALVPPCETHAPVGSVLKDPYDAITHTEPRSHGGSSIAQHRTQAPCLGVSV